MNVHITVVGNIADAPEQRTLPTGETVIRFNLAASVRRQEDGVWKDAHTSWYRVSAYRKLAENALASLQKGQRVIVAGRLKLRRWESNDKQGTDAEIDADALGHDLLFGRTQFVNTARATDTSDRSTDAGATTPTRTTASAWAQEPTPGSGPHLDPVEDREPEPVGATAPTATWDTRPLGDQPF